MDFCTNSLDRLLASLDRVHTPAIAVRYHRASALRVSIPFRRSVFPRSTLQRPSRPPRSMLTLLASAVVPDSSRGDHDWRAKAVAASGSVCLFCALGCRGTIPFSRKCCFCVSIFLSSGLPKVSFLVGSVALVDFFLGPRLHGNKQPKSVGPVRTLEGTPRRSEGCLLGWMPQPDEEDEV